MKRTYIHLFYNYINVYFTTIDIFKYIAIFLNIYIFLIYLNFNINKNIRKLVCLSIRF